MIKLQVIGHLGKDCTTNQVNGKRVINFSVAHSEKYKDAQGNQVEKTVWVECAYWNDSKVDQYLTKGTQVYVEGTPEVRQWTGNNGTQGASLTLRVFSIQLLGGGEKKQQQDTPQRQDPNGGLPFDELPGNQQGYQPVSPNSDPF